MSQNLSAAKPQISFGIRAPNSGPLATAESMVQVAQEAESLGYDSVWVPLISLGPTKFTALISLPAPTMATRTTQARISMKR
jgi:alkanesulfonate monooxygenase SsuD/methylene tetrahydromethanopterin reductase-like flavin-dependent oxidoreductase (luciferase family)